MSVNKVHQEYVVAIRACTPNTSEKLDAPKVWQRASADHPNSCAREKGALTPAWPGTLIPQSERTPIYPTSSFAAGDFFL